ncbi:MAG: SMI1/KNR4 family protein [Leptospiraceae bacterium]|nr:SMI1/KNR4 family protein [Leptospiraceae bacterium]
MKQVFFTDFDFSDFWDDDEYAIKKYLSEFPEDKLILSIETELGGYKLPKSYIELMKQHNGGMPKNTCFPLNDKGDYIEITGIFGIGREKTYSLCGQLGSTFMIEEWEYPDTGVYICDCPSAGHDMVMLDYSKCGKEGEPEVVHVDQEDDYRKTFLAKNFEEFIRGLLPYSEFDKSEEYFQKTLETLKSGKFSKLLKTFFKKEKAQNFENILRNLLTELSQKKGYFALHEDDLSYLVYDIQFYLYSKYRKISSRKTFLKAYPNMLAFGDGEISTGGYAPGFVENWFDKRLKDGSIIEEDSGKLQFSVEYQKLVLQSIQNYNKSLN